MPELNYREQKRQGAVDQLHSEIANAVTRFTATLDLIAGLPNTPRRPPGRRPKAAANGPAEEQQEA